MKKLIVVADWASDSLTSQEIRSTVEGYIKSDAYPSISFVSSTPSTVHTAYILEQIVRTESVYGKPDSTVIFQNTDPRLADTGAVQESKGAEFVILKLHNGIYVCGPNAGYDFSFLKNQISQAFIYQNLDKGSQFRSRDLYARICAQLMESLEDDLQLEEISIDQIPTIDGYYVGHIDNYGNIKTTIQKEDLKGKVELGEKISVEINGVKQELTYVSNLFGGGVNLPVIYPGSSGDKANPYIEISMWTHFTDAESKTGKDLFHNPHPGQKILLT